jgi:hypothetical protein
MQTMDNIQNEDVIAEDRDVLVSTPITGEQGKRFAVL